MKNLKRKYNKWLFKKYGANVGLFFEKIPTIYKLCPLWSPSMYYSALGETIVDWFRGGLEKGMKSVEEDDNAI